MGRVIRRSNSKVNNTLKKGELVQGTNNVNYGPTSSTGFYAGRNIPVGGYVVYKTYPSNGIAVYAPANDTDLLRVLNHLGANTQNLTTALSWAANDSTISVLNNPLPNTVTNGLIINIDAKLDGSYPRSGSVFYDISGTERNGQIFNSPTFNSNRFLTLDGIDDYIDLGNTVDVNPTNVTLSVWVNFSSFSTRPHIGKGGGSTGSYYIVVETNGTPVFYFDTGSGWLSVSSNTTILTNRWYNIVGTYNGTQAKIYINGVDRNTTNRTGSLRTNDSGNLRVGNGYGGAYFVNGKFSELQLYNRGLTQAEVLQNYYEAPIVTDGLIYALDASNFVSYENGNSVTYPLIGTVNGNFFNGVGFNQTNGGVFSLDGTNDYIRTASLVPMGTNWSIESWFYLNTLPVLANVFSTAQGGQGWYASTINSNNLRWYIDGGWRTTGALLSTNTWYHLVAVVEGRNHYYYLNGNRVFTYTSLGDPLSDSFATIGRITDVNERYFPGFIANCYVYNRALNILEVRQNFNARSQRFL